MDSNSRDPLFVCLTSITPARASIFYSFSCISLAAFMLPAYSFRSYSDCQGHWLPSGPSKDHWPHVKPSIHTYAEAPAITPGAITRTPLAASAGFRGLPMSYYSYESMLL